MDPACLVRGVLALMKAMYMDFFTPSTAFVIFPFLPNPARRVLFLYATRGRSVQHDQIPRNLGERDWDYPQGVRAQGSGLRA